MKITSLFIYLSTSIILFSCRGGEREDSMELTQDCIEEKYDDGDGLTKFKSIDEALTAYDFESARVLLSCYEDACFANGIRQNGCPKKYSNSSKQWYDVKAGENEHFKMLYKIVQAEVTYFLIAGENSRALASVSESDLLPVYKDKLPYAINKLVDDNKYDLVLKVLSQYTFEAQFIQNEPTYINREYNNEISEFNDMLSSLSNAALFEGNAEVLKKCLLLIKPIAVEDTKGPKTPYGFSHSLLSDNPKKELIAKIKEAGIKL